MAGSRGEHRVQQITGALAAAGIGAAVLLGGLAYAQDQDDEAAGSAVDTTSVTTTTPTSSIGSSTAESWPSMSRSSASSGVARSSGS